MGWAKFDDQFTDHPKVQAVGPMAELLAMRAVVYAARYETDGLIRESVLPRLAAGIQSPRKQIEALLRENLWEEVPEGWLIHDFLDYHPSREEREAERQAARERMRNVRANKPRTTNARSGEHAPNIPRSSGNPDPTRPIPDPSSTDLGDSERVTSSEVVQAPRARNPVWDALVVVFGEPTTDTARTLRGKMVASLGRAGATGADVVDRARSWPLHFPDATLTETALEKHWDRLGRPPLKLSSGQVEQLADRQRSASRLARADELDRKALGS